MALKSRTFKLSSALLTFSPDYDGDVQSDIVAQGFGSLG